MVQDHCQNAFITIYHQRARAFLVAVTDYKKWMHTAMINDKPIHDYDILLCLLCRFFYLTHFLLSFWNSANLQVVWITWYVYHYVKWTEQVKRGLPAKRFVENASQTLKYTVAAITNVITSNNKKCIRLSQWSVIVSWGNDLCGRFAVNGNGGLITSLIFVCELFQK